MARRLKAKQETKTKNNNKNKRPWPQLMRVTIHSQRIISFLCFEACHKLRARGFVRGVVTTLVCQPYQKMLDNTRCALNQNVGHTPHNQSVPVWQQDTLSKRFSFSYEIACLCQFSYYSLTLPPRLIAEHTCQKQFDDNVRFEQNALFCHPKVSLMWKDFLRKICMHALSHTTIKLGAILIGVLFVFCSSPSARSIFVVT